MPFSFPHKSVHGDAMVFGKLYSFPGNGRSGNDGGNTCPDNLGQIISGYPSACKYNRLFKGQPLFQSPANRFIQRVMAAHVLKPAGNLSMKIQRATVSAARITEKLPGSSKISSAIRKSRDISDISLPRFIRPILHFPGQHCPVSLFVPKKRIPIRPWKKK